MRYLLCSMCIKLFLEKSINRLIYIEWRARWSADAFYIVEIKTARTFNKQFDARAANLERFIVRLFIHSSCFYFELFFHLVFGLIYASVYSDKLFLIPSISNSLACNFLSSSSKLSACFFDSLGIFILTNSPNGKLARAELTE